MPTKHNKIRYKSEDKDRPTITITGNVFLQFRDDEQLATAQKGDVVFFPNVEELATVAQGDYYSARYSGYFKADIFDGKEWKPLLLQEFYPQREQYFSKKEYPIDTFTICAEIFSEFNGRKVERSYREHYKLINSDEE